MYARNSAVICPAGHGGQQEELLASQCTASQRPTRMCSHVCIDHRKPYVYPRVLHRAVSTFSTRSCAHRHLRAQTTSQLPYSVCEARSLLELRREVAREGTEDRVAIALVVLVQYRLVRLHQCAANTSRRSAQRDSSCGSVCIQPQRRRRGGQHRSWAYNSA